MSDDSKRRSIQIKYGFRSGLEEKISDQLENSFVPFKYEEVKIHYIQPEISRMYTPDFELTKKDGTPMIIETKGRFVLEDRKKMQLIKDQYPTLDIRFVFSNANAKLRKGAKTSYAQWCEKNNYPYADKVIPKEWLDELRTSD